MKIIFLSFLKCNFIQYNKWRKHNAYEDVQYAIRFYLLILPLISKGKVMQLF